jgi:drug/metabolite transporter (DMT)-like permease
MPTLAPAVQVALLMLLANACGACMNIVIRQLSAELHPFEIAFFRNLFGFVAMLPFLGGVGLGMLRTHHLGRLLATGAAQAVSMLCMFTAITLMPLAQMTALTFTKPLFVTIGAVLILHEVVRARRWSAVVIGFLGVLIVVRPGAGAMTLAALLPLFAALCYALGMIATRRLSRSDGVAAIVIFGNLTTIAASSGLLAFGWKTPALGDLWAFVIMGLLGGSITFFLTQAYRLAPAAVVAPFDYTTLVWVAAIGWLVWREVPDSFVWLGAAIIIASGLYILYRETRVPP